MTRFNNDKQQQVQTRLQPLKGWQRLIVGVMALAFLASGLSLLGSLVYGSAYGYWRTRSEVCVDAKMLSVERIQSSIRGSVTWNLKAKYEYQVNGKNYVGSRVTLFTESNSFYPALFSALHSSQPVRVYIDPDNASFAVVDRTFSFWPIVVGVPFVAMGCFLVWALLKAPRASASPTKEYRIS